MGPSVLDVSAPVDVSALESTPESSGITVLVLLLQAKKPTDATLTHPTSVAWNMRFFFIGFSSLLETWRSRVATQSEQKSDFGSI
jgi:hypothetical protein